MDRWISLGKLVDLEKGPLQEVSVAGQRVVLARHEGRTYALQGSCPHAGGALAQGALSERGELMCPLHRWAFDVRSGEPLGRARGRLAGYALKEEDGELWIDPTPTTAAVVADVPTHALRRTLRRAPGPLRVVGISTTMVNAEQPRVSTSNLLLEEALAEAQRAGAEARMIKLADLQFRTCEGYYSRSAEACTWPCAITQMDASDQLERVYEALVFWADVVLIATPIRWGAASSLYYKMAERMNCIENQRVVAGRTLIQRKTAAFIVTGGQDNIQAVAGQMMVFFSILGYALPPQAFVGHSRGWTAEDMENNVRQVQESPALRREVRALVGRSLALARTLVPEAAALTSPKAAEAPPGPGPAGERPGS